VSLVLLLVQREVVVVPRVDRGEVEVRSDGAAGLAPRDLEELSLVRVELVVLGEVLEDQAEPGDLAVEFGFGRQRDG
jgi:hypothetical protein